MKLILTLEDIIPRENVTKTVDFMLKEGMREPVAHALIFILAQTFVSNLTVDAQVGEGSLPCLQHHRLPVAGLRS